MSDLAGLEEDAGLEMPFDRMSDAEQVMILHRDSKRIQHRDDGAKKLQ